MKRGEKARNRSKGTRCTQYSDEILSIFGINIVKDTTMLLLNIQVPSTISCLKKRVWGLRSKEEQLRVLT